MLHTGMGIANEDETTVEVPVESGVLVATSRFGSARFDGETLTVVAERSTFTYTDAEVVAVDVWAPFFPFPGMFRVFGTDNRMVIVSFSRRRETAAFAAIADAVSHPIWS